jgi:hypothetical protein
VLFELSAGCVAAGGHKESGSGLAVIGKLVWGLGCICWRLRVAGLGRRRLGCWFRGL